MHLVFQTGAPLRAGTAPRSSRTQGARPPCHVPARVPTGRVLSAQAPVLNHPGPTASNGRGARARSPSPSLAVPASELERSAAEFLSSWARARGAAAAPDRHTHTFQLVWESDIHKGGATCGAGVATCMGVHDADGNPAAAIAVALQLSSGPGGEGSPLQPGDEQVSIHWATAKGAGKKWLAPPPGWHTLPDASYDAGGGAWQSPMQGAMVDGPLPVQVHLAVIQLPLTHQLSESGSGIQMVFKTNRNAWLKVAPSAQGSRPGDFFVPTSDLPRAAAPARRTPTPSASRRGARSTVQSGRNKANGVGSDLSPYEGGSGNNGSAGGNGSNGHNGNGNDSGVLLGRTSYTSKELDAAVTDFAPAGRDASQLSQPSKRYVHKKPKFGFMVPPGQRTV
mmetsp:Transcript_16854/g.42178  ORF Transcript_16854/g.42178 Transcript_16854/m.42178 type:complete len:394 (-) Transcript_16854:728-1909(-)